MKKDEKSNTWYKIGKKYRCGICHFMPFTYDIKSYEICPKCGQRMNWYETDDGLKEIKHESGNPHEHWW